MSISLALIPVALALRAVIGKDQFNTWVESMQVKVETNFTSEDDIVRTVTKAGYDAQKVLGTLKTHLNGEQLFFFWECIDGKYYAVFGKSDSNEIIQKFIRDVEHAAGHTVFLSRADVGNVANQTQTFPTNFRDGELLMRTLREFGVNPDRKMDGSIVCAIKKTIMTFKQANDAPFLVEVKNIPNANELHHYLSDLDEEYKRIVQSNVYEKLMKKIEEKKMSVESEELLPDHSILITLNV